MPHMSVILLLPPVKRPENKTQQMYAQVSARQYTSGKNTQDFINMLEGKAAAPGLSLYNVFDDVGFRFFPGLAEYRQKFLAAGAQEVHLAGSGPTLYSAMRNETKANEIHEKLIKMKLEAYLTDF